MAEGLTDIFVKFLELRLSRAFRAASVLMGRIRYAAHHIINLTVLHCQAPTLSSEEYAPHSFALFKCAPVLTLALAVFRY